MLVIPIKIMSQTLHLKAQKNKVFEGRFLLLPNKAFSCLFESAKISPFLRSFLTLFHYHLQVYFHSPEGAGNITPESHDKSHAPLKFHHALAPSGKAKSCQKSCIIINSNDAQK